MKYNLLQHTPLATNVQVLFRAFKVLNACNFGGPLKFHGVERIGCF